MRQYPSTNIRNIAVIGHGKTGKTTLLDACLFNTGAVKRQGSVDVGTSVFDTEAEERDHRMTTALKIAACEWHGYKLNFLDTPGFPDFQADVLGALTAADSALILVSAASGVKVETEKLWKHVVDMDLPRAFFINKMDKERADFPSVVDELRMRFGRGVIPVQIPVGQGASFQGVADLLSLHVKIMTHDAPSVQADIPEYIQGEVDDAREQMIESLAEFNNELMEKYIEGKEITEVETGAALIEGIQARKIFPVFCGSAKSDIGIMKLMTELVEYMPTPYFKVSIGEDPLTGELKERTTEDGFSAQVFKTIVDPFVGRRSFVRILSGKMKGDRSYYHAQSGKSLKVGKLTMRQGLDDVDVASCEAGDICILSRLPDVGTGDTLSAADDPIRYEKVDLPLPTYEMSIVEKDKDDFAKVMSALSKQCEEEPVMRVVRREETGETCLLAMGEMQTTILTEKVERRYGLKLVLKDPAIAYRETIRKSARAEGRYKKQNGGHGQFADVHLELTPRETGTGNEFSEHIFGGTVPRQFIPAVQKGVEEALSEGVLSGYSVVDVHVDLYDGEFHPVDSSEAAFKAAAALAIRKGVMEADPVLLEPIADLVIKTPEYFTGDVVGRLNAKRARILGIEPAGKDMNTIRSLTPFGELIRFTTELRSLTQGRGTFRAKFDSYREMPQELVDKMMEERETKG